MTTQRIVRAGVTCLFTVALALTAPRLEAVSQATELDGMWLGVKSTVGEAERAFKEGELWLQFSGSQLEAKGLLGPQVVTLAVVINPKDKHLDYPRKPGEMVECLYQLEGDTLVLAVPRASTARPVALSPTSSDSVLLYLTRRR